jgi:hypothetical protein
MDVINNVVTTTVVTTTTAPCASVVPGQLGLEIATARTPRVLAVRYPFVYFVVGR